MTIMILDGNQVYRAPKRWTDDPIAVVTGMRYIEHPRDGQMIRLR